MQFLHQVHVQTMIFSNGNNRQNVREWIGEASLCGGKEETTEDTKENKRQENTTKNLWKINDYDMNVRKHRKTRQRRPWTWRYHLEQRRRRSRKIWDEATTNVCADLNKLQTIKNNKTLADWLDKLWNGLAGEMRRKFSLFISKFCDNL